MLPKGKVGEFEIDGKKIPVYVNLNTAARFDEISDKSLNSLIGKMWAMYSGKKRSDLSIEEILQVVDWGSLRALASASLHSYDSSLDIRYHYSPTQLGASLEMEQWAELLGLIFKGLGDYMVRSKDLPQSLQKGGGAASSADPTPTPAVEKEKNGGGATSTGLDVAILDSLEKVSDVKPSGASTSDGRPGKSESSEPSLEPPA